MITNTQLVKYCEQAVGHEYWYGCFGQKATESLLAYKRKQYPQYYDRSKYTKGWTCDGRRVFDCVNLIKAAIWANGNFNADPVYNSAQDVNAGGMLNLCKTKGKIGTLPEVPGTLLFKPGHVGVYIGNGMMIHAAGHNRGVVKEKRTNIEWTDWGHCPWIDYTSEQLAQAVTDAFIEANKTAAAIQDQPEQKTKVESITYTHKVIKNVNVRKGPGVTHKKIEYADFPEYIKKQIKQKSSYIPVGVKVHCYENKKGWYRIDKNKQIWIAGNYAKKI